MRGKVRKLEAFGAFVEIAPGIDGLVHVSRMVADRRISHPKQAVAVGDEVDVTVLSIDTEQRRIALSMVEGARREQEAAEHSERRGGGGAREGQRAARPRHLRRAPAALDQRQELTTAACAGRFFAALALVVVVAAGLALVEGVASLLISAGLLFGSSGRLAQERYARYDPDLGWVSKPNVAIPDMYGPGADLHTTSQGFRGTVDPGPTPPPGKTRVVCSGDSFTFGYGVGDDFTWCAGLAKLDPRLETINMGQGGYGVDQAFLWYRRDGAALAPAIHIFAFIDGDFERTRGARFLDFGKPTLALRGGTLAGRKRAGMAPPVLDADRANAGGRETHQDVRARRALAAPRGRRPGDPRRRSRRAERHHGRRAGDLPRAPHHRREK